MPLKCFANYPTCYFQDTIHAVIIQFLNLLMQSFSWKKFITFVKWTFKGAIDALRSVLMMQKWASLRAKCLKFFHHVTFSLCYNLTTFKSSCSKGFEEIDLNWDDIVMSLLYILNVGEAKQNNTLIFNVNI